MSEGKDEKLTYKEKAAISFVQQEEPLFIQKMKQQMGYKAPAKIEDKFEQAEDLPETTEGELLRTKEEERPQVVVLDPATDLTAEEVNEALVAQERLEDERKIAEGRITFKQPMKRTPTKRSADGKEVAKENTEDKRQRVKGPTPSRLLSFLYDEED